MALIERVGRPGSRPYLVALGRLTVGGPTPFPTTSQQSDRASPPRLAVEPEAREIWEESFMRIPERLLKLIADHFLASNPKREGAALWGRVGRLWRLNALSATSYRIS